MKLKGQFRHQGIVRGEQRGEIVTVGHREGPGGYIRVLGHWLVPVVSDRRIQRPLTGRGRGSPR